MTEFKPLNLRKYEPRLQAETPDKLYWQRLSVPSLVKEFGAIDYIDFSPVEPYCFAVTCSVRVQIYNPVTKLVVKNLSRFQQTAYGGNFRKDGRLLVAGDEQGYVKLFDSVSKNVLRLFKGHKGPVHRTFFTADKLNLASFSDDHSVRLWDISNEKTLHTYAEAHTDYIRAGAMNPVSTNVFVSGSYDGKINIYDTRTNEITNTVDHGRPVESLLFLPSGGIFFSAGDTEVRVWDMFAGGRLLTTFSEHHKTITSLCLGSNGRRLLSAGLDRHVKIYDVATYQTVHSMKFPNDVLSLGISPNDQVVVAGMVDGLISIQTMPPGRKPNEEQQLIRSLNASKSRSSMVKVDHLISEQKRQTLAQHDKFFRNYEYNKALNIVLTKKNIAKNPTPIIAVFQELIQRKGLERALTNRPTASLQVILKFIIRYIGEHRFMRILTDVSNELLNIYERNFHEFNKVLSREFETLAKVLSAEVKLTRDLLELQGVIELFTMASGSDKIQDETLQYLKVGTDKLQPSVQAEECSILEI